MHDANSIALIRLPGEQEYQYFQSLGSISETENQLILQPFDPSQEPIIFKSATIGIESFIPNKKFANCPYIETDRNKYNENISNAQVAFSNSDLKKVVLSRIKIIDHPIDFNLLNYFKSMAIEYPHTAASLFVFDESAWIGASPELLLHKDGNRIETMALAGTRKLSSDIEFKVKEFDEQSIVTETICEALKEFCIENSIEIKEREIQSAGAVSHLKNQIHGQLKEDISTKKILNKLHPTPAISGFPKMDSIDFISKHETHQRDLYGGYWGIKNNMTENYFVQIRCMQVFKDKIVLYAGGGITAASIASEEWDETTNKMETLITLL